MSGQFATFRRGFDASDAEFALRQAARNIPDGAIARMMGRSVQDVSAVTRPPLPLALERVPVIVPPPKPKRRYKRTEGVAAHYSEPARGGKPPPEGTMAACVWWAAAKHGVTVADIMGPSRLRPIAYARHEAMWEAYEVRLLDGSRKYGRPRIGLYFKRDRQTVWSAIRAHPTRAALTRACFPGVADE